MAKNKIFAESKKWIVASLTLVNPADCHELLRDSRNNENIITCVCLAVDLRSESQSK